MKKIKPRTFAPENGSLAARKRADLRASAQGMSTVKVPKAKTSLFKHQTAVDRMNRAATEERNNAVRSAQNEAAEGSVSSMRKTLELTNEALRVNEGIKKSLGTGKAKAKAKVKAKAKKPRRARGPT